MREQFNRDLRSLQGPAWRSRFAQELARSDNPLQVSTRDPLVIETAGYYALCSGGGDGSRRAAQKYPHVEAAFALQADDEPTNSKTDAMKLLILANAPTAAIAERVGIEPAVVDAWERLFFDVRDLLGATGWLSSQVIEAASQAGDRALAARMKVALTAGIDGVEAILALDGGVPVDEAERILQRRRQLGLKFDEAVNMPIDNDRSRLRFIKLYLDLTLAEKKLNLASQKLAARCARARERHELAQLRLAAAAQRAEFKAREQAEKAERRRRQEAAVAEKQELQRQADLVRPAEKKVTAGQAAPAPLSRVSPAAANAQRAPRSAPRPVSPVTAVMTTPGKPAAKRANSKQISRRATAEKVPSLEQGNRREAL
jgi:hypothetical protein